MQTLAIVDLLRGRGRVIVWRQASVSSVEWFSGISGFGFGGFSVRSVDWLVCWLIPRGSVDCCESSGVRVEFCQARVGLFIGLEV